MNRVSETERPLYSTISLFMRANVPCRAAPTEPTSYTSRLSTAAVAKRIVQTESQTDDYSLFSPLLAASKKWLALFCKSFQALVLVFLIGLSSLC